MRKIRALSFLLVSFFLVIRSSFLLCALISRKKKKEFPRQNHSLAAFFVGISHLSFPPSFPTFFTPRKKKRISFFLREATSRPPPPPASPGRAGSWSAPSWRSSRRGWSRTCRNLNLNYLINIFKQSFLAVGNSRLFVLFGIAGKVVKRLVAPKRKSDLIKCGEWHCGHLVEKKSSIRFCSDTFFGGGKVNTALLCFPERIAEPGA